jgi:hypothetical protein
MINKIRKSNFTLGISRDKNYNTESTDRFKKLPGSASYLDPKALKELRGHHYAFGDDPTNYMTQS